MGPEDWQLLLLLLLLLLLILPLLPLLLLLLLLLLFLLLPLLLAGVGKQALSQGRNLVRLLLSGVPSQQPSVRLRSLGVLCGNPHLQSLLLPSSLLGCRESREMSLWLGEVWTIMRTLQPCCVCRLRRAFLLVC